MKKYFLLLMLSMAIVACSKDSDQDSPAPDPVQQGDIFFGVGVSGAATRAPIESGTSGIPNADVHGVQVIRGLDGGTISATTSFNTLPITTTATIKGGTGQMPLNAPQYFNAAKDNAHFLAFYPAAVSYTPGTGTAAAVALYEINGSQDIIYAAPRTAVFNTSGAGTVINDMVFDHLMARVELKFIAEDDDAVLTFGNLEQAEVSVSKNLKLSIFPDGTKTFAPANTTKFTLKYDGLTLTTAGATTSKGFMIYPGDVISSFGMRFNKKTAQRYTLDSPLTLQAGRTHIITFVVKASHIEFDGLEVEPWVEVDNTGNPIEIEPGQ